MMEISANYFGDEKMNSVRMKRFFFRVAALIFAAVFFCAGFSTRVHAVDNSNGLVEGTNEDSETFNPILSTLTEEERQFVRSGAGVVVGFYEETEPLAYIEEDGTYGGIYIELLQYIKEETGLNLIFYPISRDYDWRDYLRSGEIDFFTGTSISLIAQDDSFRATDPILEYDNYLVTRNDCAFNDLDAPRIALTHGRSFWEEVIRKSLDNPEIKYYTSAKECLLALRHGEADGVLLNNIEYNYQSKNNRFSNMIQWESYRFTSGTSLAALADIDDTMFSTVNKAIGLLSKDYVNAVINAQLNMPYHSYDFADMVFAARYFLFVFGVLVLTALIVGKAIYSVRRRQNIILQEAQEREKHRLKILAALSRDYSSVYYTNLDEDCCEAMLLSETKQADRNVRDTVVYSETLGQYVDDYVLPEFRESLKVLCRPEELIRRLKGEPDFSVRYQIKPNEKHQEYFEIHFVDVSENGQHSMVFGIRCVDETVKDEQEQKKILREALEAANRANLAKSDFLSKMSHDIRTPMNAIIGMTAIAATHLDNPERMKDALGKISSSSRHLLGLINEVLDMSKIESGTISLAEEEFKLSDLLNNILIMVQPQIHAHAHDLQVHVKDIKHEDVVGDSLRIQQIFVNIISNSVKYTPDGGKISLTVREKPTASPRLGCYEFIFSDNGIGMSKDYVEHIFEPFSRAEDVRVSKTQGTGLGMAIAQNIVHLMNGSIQVESELGKGSTFIVTIFLKFRDQPEMDVSELAQLPVLVADDDDDARESICFLLDEIGMKSEGYPTGEEAVEAVDRTQGTPDQFYAAILDWRMPGMDGVETARAIKRLTRDDLPIIILSAYDWSDIELEARAAGVDAFLSKPVFKSGLIRMFKKLKSGELAEEPARQELKAFEESDYSGRKVLLVEDNELNREIAREILEMAGFLVDEAENGKIAVDKFSASHNGEYHMILMDIQMPVMNGYDAAMAIRSLKRPDALHVPIIAMTANAFVEDIQAAKTAGMNEHLAKPIDFNELNGVLKKYLL